MFALVGLPQGAVGIAYTENLMDITCPSWVPFALQEHHQEVVVIALRGTKHIQGTNRSLEPASSATEDNALLNAPLEGLGGGGWDKSEE